MYIIYNIYIYYNRLHSLEIKGKVQLIILYPFNQAAPPEPPEENVDCFILFPEGRAGA